MDDQRDLQQKELEEMEQWFIEFEAWFAAIDNDNDYILGYDDGEGKVGEV